MVAYLHQENLVQDQAAAKPLGYASTARPQKYACGMPQFSQVVFSISAVDGGNWFREVFSDTDINLHQAHW